MHHPSTHAINTPPTKYKYVSQLGKRKNRGMEALVEYDKTSQFAGATAWLIVAIEQLCVCTSCPTWS